MRLLAAALACALLAACSGDIDTPSSAGPDLSRIKVVNVETRVAQNADVWFGDAEAQVTSETRRESTPEDQVYLTPREHEARVRDQISAGVTEAVVDALRGMPSGDLPVVVELVVTRYRIRSLLRGALLGSDHEADATLTLRDAISGRPVSEPLSLTAESTEQVAILGGLQLRAIRPSPQSRLDANLAEEVRKALDRVARKS
jgi:hypothetical protein